MVKGPLAEDGNHWLLNCGDFIVQIYCVLAQEDAKFRLDFRKWVPE